MEDDDNDSTGGAPIMGTNWAFVAAGVAACGVMAAPAGLASAEGAQDVINGLQAKGYSVTIDKIGTAPISECVVTNVRNPQTITQLLPYRGPGSGRRDNILVPVIVSQSVSVSLDCSR